MSKVTKKTKRVAALGKSAATPALKPKVKRKSERAFPYVRILIGEMVLGPGKVDLLEAIGRTGSISAAGRELGMSYRRAWLLVDTMNRCFKRPVVDAEAGGQRGGGTALTPLGAQVVLRYRNSEALAAKAAAAEIAALARLLRRAR